MMMVQIHGQVIRQRCGTPIPHARVEVASVEHDELDRQSRTSREGAFVFTYSGTHATTVSNCLKTLTVRVTDRLGSVVSTCVANEGNDTLVFALDEDQFGQGGFSLPERRPILRGDFGATLQAAVTHLPQADQPGAQAILNRLTCALPPALIELDILDIAQGVMRGRVDDLRRFGEVIDRIEVWARAGNIDIQNRSEAEAYSIVKDLGSVSPHNHEGQHLDGMISLPDRMLLLASASVSAANQVEFVKTIELIYTQIALGDWLHGLLNSAWEAISGAPQAFRLNLASFGGCSPGARPFPFPPDFGGGFPWPTPHPFPWPTPRGPSLPSVRECDAEVARAFNEALGRNVEYTIDSIDPQNACPGETITIRGSNLRFEEADVGAVWFSGGRRDMPIRAVVTSSSNTEIEVVVPHGAMCGPIELDSPRGSVLLVCGTELELFQGPTTPFVFEGGETSIRRFQHTAADCAKTHDTVVFTWEICNSEEHSLTLIKREGGHVETITPPRAATQNHYSHVLASGTLDYELEAVLEARGRCGTDQRRIRFGVQRALRRAGDSPFSGDTFINWHQNIRRPVRSSTPRSLQELVEAVLAAERAGAKVGSQGTGWSFSDCVVPASTTHLIDTSELGSRITHVLPEVLRDSIDLVFPATLDATLTGLSGPLPATSRLMHVEAGIKVHQLNRLLDLQPVPLAMPTLGGSNGQSVAGAFSTGTHGANPAMPPIADFVRAIHLVGPGGQQWWIESSSQPITDAARMESLKTRGLIDPCLKVVYGDGLFNACLVSMGCAGVIYSVVLEGVPAHRLSSTTAPQTSWTAARSMVQGTIDAPIAAAPWFSEVVLNASRATWITTRVPVPLTTPLDVDGCPVSAPSESIDEMLVLLFGAASVTGLVGLGTGAVAALVGAIPFYIARRTAEISLQPWLWGEVRDEIEFIERLIRTLNDLGRIISGGDDQVIADAIPNILNVLWQMGLYVVDGRTIVEQAQNLFTTLGQRPAGTTTFKSYTAMTGQCDVTLPTYQPPGAHTPFERLVQSYEFALPASETLRFVDDILRASDPIRETNDALILNVALRFTGGTRAFLGMQQPARTGHVELFTIRGMAGNSAMHSEIDRIAREHRAIPHWGQFHEVLSDYSRLFPDLAGWRSAMNRIALESAREAGGNANTFRQQFAIDRGLLSTLP